MLSRLSPLLFLLAGASVAPQGTVARDGAEVAADSGDLVRYALAEGETLEQVADAHFLRPEDWRKARALNGAAADAGGATLLLDTGWLKRTPLTAEVIAFRGPAVARVAGAEVPVRRGLILSEGDRLATGPVGFATLRLPDGSLLSLPTNSAIRFERLRRYTLNGAIDRRIRVETGSLDQRVTPLQDETSRYEVQTDLGVAAVRGTQFRVGFTPGRMSAEVTEGEIGVTGADRREVSVPLGFGILVGPDGAGRPLKLPAAPVLREAPALDGGTEALLSVRAEPGLSYRAILATDADFVDRVAEVASGDGRFRFTNLAAGSYHVAVSALLPSGLAGPATVVRFDRSGRVAMAAAAPASSAPSPPPPAPAPADPGAGSAIGTSESGPQASLAAAASSAEALAEDMGMAEGDADAEGETMAEAAVVTTDGPWSAMPYRLPAGGGRSTGGAAFAPSAGHGLQRGGGGGGPIVPGSVTPPVPEVDPPLPPLPDGNFAGPPPVLPVLPDLIPPAPPPGSTPGSVPDGVPDPAPAPPIPGAVPEPATWAQLLGGFAFLGMALRRSRRKARAL
jgi:hypothetical protein